MEKYEDAIPLETRAVDRVGVRIPPFWPNDPSLWFDQIEGQFALANITSDSTRFYYVTSQLEHQYAAEVKDIISRPPDSGKYEKLKGELIRRLSMSKNKKVQQLLMHEEIGDRKPSQFLRHLQSLAGSSMPDEFMRTLWSGRLPHYIQTLIASHPDMPLSKVADLADQILEIVPPNLQVASSSSTSTSSCKSIEATLNLMAKQISELTSEVAELKTSRMPRNRSRSRPRYRHRSRSHSRSAQPPSNHPHCWYHFTYGLRAKKCVKPCSFVDSENSLGSRN
ncbi:uncharacterized protein [Epargyreus clarus]|uniref:uncharacterized protein n=1 Tax=Epargyreus clarus TaxID=520877 RepID=UPI003C2E43D4